MDVPNMGIVDTHTHTQNRIMDVIGASPNVFWHFISFLLTEQRWICHRCSNYIWVINKFIVYWGDLRGLMEGQLYSCWYLGSLHCLFTSNHGSKDWICRINRSWSSITEDFNTLRPKQNGRHFADAIFKCIFFNENEWILLKISLKFVPKGQINNIPALVQIMAWRRPGDKPLSEPMMVSLPTHICITWPQWVKHLCHLTVGVEKS